MSHRSAVRPAASAPGSAVPLRPAGITRRRLLGAGALTLLAGPPLNLLNPQETNDMYGLIGKIRARPGQREALAAVLVEGVAGMPGCLSYVVARDSEDADALWVTEVWDSEASHAGSLELPSVQEAIARGRPMIAGFEERFVTEPVGGHGLQSS